MEQTTINNLIGAAGFIVLILCIPAGIYYLGNNKRFQSCLIILIAFLGAYTMCYSWEEDRNLRGIPADIDTYRGRNRDLVVVYEKIHKKDNIISFSKTSAQRAEIKEILLENNYEPKAITQTEIIYIRKGENKN